MVNPDGSFSVRQFDVPINYEAKDGEFEPIDNELVEAPGAAYAVENQANEFTASIPQDPATTPVRFELDGAWASLRMHGLAETAPEVDDYAATLAIDETSEEADTSGGASEVVYEVQNTGLKETITLDAPPSPTEMVSYTYDLATSPGLTPLLRSSGRIDFVAGAGDAEAEVAFSIPVGNMTDSAEEPVFTEDVAYALEPKAGQGAGWVLTVEPSMSWLTDPARVYPVAIDPSITPTASSDCWVQSASPTISQCGDTQTGIRVGRSSSTSLFRGLLDFELSGIPGDATINSASLRVYLESQSTNATGQYAVHLAGKSWNNNATWNKPTTGSTTWTGGDPGGTAYGSQAISPSIANQYETFGGLGPVVQEWVDGTTVNRGLVLRQVGDNTSSGVNNQLSFRSSHPQAFNDGKRPYLAINYTLPASAVLADAGDRNFWTYEERDLTDRITAKVNVGNGNFHLRAEDGSIAGVAGWDLALTRYYNSAAAVGGEATPAMGLGWSSAFGGSVRLQFPSGPSNNNRVQFFGVLKWPR